jgi:F-type H+-transporting ATPase subunit gamma
MPSLIDLRRRIRSVNNTQQITKAMKMVSAAKLRRTQQAVVNARPYATLLGEMLGSVLSQAGEDSAAGEHPLLAKRKVKRILLIFLAGDKGLCGAFNTNVTRASTKFLNDHSGTDVELELLGRKAVDYYSRRSYPIVGKWELVFKNVEYSIAQEIAEKAMRRFSDGEVDEVYILYNRFLNVLTQEITLTPLLPILPSEGNGDGASVDYEYEQPPVQLFATLLPKHVVTQVYQAMLDSAAAEHAARMTAMDSATRNAGEVLEKLTLHLNRVRQASITTEIIEIVSGAAAAE